MSLDPSFRPDDSRPVAGSRFSASIVALDLYSVVLHRSRFEPSPLAHGSDAGRIGPLAIHRCVRGDDGIVRHFHRSSSRSAVLRIGQTVACEIDGVRRHRLARLHASLCLLELGTLALGAPAQRRAPQVEGTMASAVFKTSTVIAPGDLGLWFRQVVADARPLVPVNRPDEPTTTMVVLDGVGAVNPLGPVVGNTGALSAVGIGVIAGEGGHLHVQAWLEEA